jgi:hypothetical protein
MIIYGINGDSGHLTTGFTADRKGRAAGEPERYALDNNLMKLRKHIRLLIFVTLAWLLFWIAGLPDYYQ